MIRNYLTLTIISNVQTDAVLARRISSTPSTAIRNIIVMDTAHVRMHFTRTQTSSVNCAEDAAHQKRR